MYLKRIKSTAGIIKMTETYSGKLEERGKGISKSNQVGLLRVEDDKLVFIFDNGKITEIMINEIKSVIPQRVRFPKGLKEPLITLKDSRKFIFCINPVVRRGGWFDNMYGAVNDNFNNIKRGNIQITKLLNYLIRK